MRIGIFDLAGFDGLTALAKRACDLDELSPDFLWRRLTADPGSAPELLLGAWSDDRLVGVAAGVVRERPTERIGHIRLLAVEPEARRRGVATALLDEIESRLARAGATRIVLGGETPGHIFPGVEVGYTAALCLFQKRGYELTHETSNMAVDLTGRTFAAPDLEERLAAAGIAVRRLAAAERRAFDAYLAANWSADWRVEALESLEADQPTGFVALRGGEIVGFACYDVSRAGWFGPTGTNAAERGRGIGAALLLRCLEAMREAGYGRVEIGWTTVWPFYAKVAGARVCRWFWQMSRPARP